MNAKSGRERNASNLERRTCRAKWPSHLKIRELCVSLPEIPIRVSANGWPCRVVFVCSHAPCGADADSCNRSHGIRCASPNLVLPCTHSRTAPKNSARLGAVLASHEC